jgi:STE24 endopeptidase
MRIALLIIYLFFLTTSFFLKQLNLKHLKEKGMRVPPEFEGIIEPETLKKAAAYTVENSRLSMVASAVNNILILFFLFGGLILVYDGWIATLAQSFVGKGVLFFLGILYLETVVGVPFGLFRNFNIESRYGFNTMTWGLWLSDLVKSILISSILTVLLVAAALYLVQLSPIRWWLWVWAVFLFFSIFLMYISPYLIEPLFFKFEPVKAEGLEPEIRALTEKAGLKVSKVLQVDASRRSRHSNAYFSGIGRVKRIVLFDTLLESMDQGEILAVLAHELGHWKKKHILKRIVVTEAVALGALYLAYKLIGWEGLPGIMGFEQGSFYVRLALVGFLGSLFMFPLSPLSSFLSRRHEWEADRYACDLTERASDLARALRKLSTENLANLHPHPLYAAFYYSHPPVVERVRRLQEQDGTGRAN